MEAKVKVWVDVNLYRNSICQFSGVCETANIVRADIGGTPGTGLFGSVYALENTEEKFRATCRAAAYP
jgi:hypothetical protein